MKKNSLFLLLLLISASTIWAQGSKIRWKKDKNNQTKTVELFHSIKAVNLPTATMLKKGEFEYEISHRFLPTLNTEGAFWGFDGPANIRMALAYAVSNRLMLNLGRSNLQDNVDFRLKYQLFQLPHKVFPALVALRGGMAWNSATVIEADGSKRDKADTKNFQYYGQVVLNTMLWKKLGIGVVPSYLYNSHIQCVDTEYSFTMGSYLQYYASAMVSFLLETNTTVTGYRGRYNSASFGVELETGGHFFKIIVANNAQLNPSQYLSGSDLKFSDGDWRLGFVITRILKF